MQKAPVQVASKENPIKYPGYLPQTKMEIKAHRNIH